MPQPTLPRLSHDFKEQRDYVEELRSAQMSYSCPAEPLKGNNQKSRPDDIRLYLLPWCCLGCTISLLLPSSILPSLPPSLYLYLSPSALAAQAELGVSSGSGSAGVVAQEAPSPEE